MWRFGYWDHCFSVILKTLTAAKIAISRIRPIQESAVQNIGYLPIWLFSFAYFESASSRISIQIPETLQMSPVSLQLPYLHA